MEKFFTWEGCGGISSPVFDADGNLLLTSSASGDVIRLAQRTPQNVANTGGMPSCVALDSEGLLHICDMAHQAILSVGDDNVLSEFVKEYEGKMFKGPNSMIFDSGGTLFFTDSGPLGETGIHSPRGSVFSITADGQLLQPLALNCLAYPAGLALSPDETIVYVSEQMNNRILRFVQRPAGVYHFSVFHQFSGGMGPTALCTDENGFVYVARYDFAPSSGASAEGKVTVLSPNGHVDSEIVVPGPEITGLTFDSAKRYLYITESSTSSVYRILVK